MKFFRHRGPALLLAALLTACGGGVIDPGDFPARDGGRDGSGLDSGSLDAGVMDGGADDAVAPDASEHDAAPSDDASCSSGERCEGACVDTQRDVRHCGACGRDCTALPGVVPWDVRCIDGTCDVSSACAPGRAHCTARSTDGCETDITTAEHCGSCSTRCSGATPLCTSSGSGTMRFACTNGCGASAPTRCGDSCVDLATNPTHCGACGQLCAAGPHASATCAAGRCERACAPGFANCDGDWSNGCEVALDSDLAHCGACGQVCAGGPNASAACVAGRCERACAPGFANCDGSWSNGCEVALQSDLANCGVCGRVCSAPASGIPTCTTGTCDFSCDSSTARCGDACVPLNDPAFGCGTCTPCVRSPHALRMQCAGGRCAIAECDTGYKLCGGACVAITAETGCGAPSCTPCALAAGAERMECSFGGACAIASCRPEFKFCGGRCEARTPLNGCGNPACIACSPQHATPMCSSTGGCDYSACDPQWRDLDGNRANGCETPTPNSVSGLRVWLAAQEPESIDFDPLCAPGTQNCVYRWRNLADSANPAEQRDRLLEPHAYGRRGNSAMAIVFGTDGAPLYGYPLDHDIKHLLNIDLSALTGPEYTVFVVTDRWGNRGHTYALGCDPGSIFSANTAFHLGWSSATNLRQGHYNNDLNLSVGDGSGSDNRAIVQARLTPTGRTLSERRRGDVVRTISDTNGARLTRAQQCAVGRGPDGGPGFLGLVFEVLVYNRALSPSETLTVETYLRRRYGL